MPRACIFCGGRPVTQEHVWPRWAQDVLPATEPIPFRQVITSEGRPTVEHLRMARPFRETVGMVCAKCNSGWMALLEQRASKLLAKMVRGERPMLDRSAQLTVAGWALKTAIVLDHAQPQPWHPTLMQAERRHLALTGEPSTNAVVWLVSSLKPPPSRARLWGASGSVELLTGERREPSSMAR